ncbi:hypothetical protein AB8989_15485 [Yersinia hibernica]|uniref:Holin n=1 Tax=Yersinia hibernica TaxID=2339259 RepID=A0ABX5R327_9GAMM|nr:hypothetical protein [Yersinia hibernica]QAX79741.1 hypothetical protein D5F51_14965 [Yersinia hibernica]
MTDAIDTLNSASQEMAKTFNADTVSHMANNTKPIWSAELVMSLSTSILVFTAFILVLITYILIKCKLRGGYILKMYTIILIISFSAYLCVTGYDNNQLAPILGLFGAIAGYLLGKDDVRKSTSNDANLIPSIPPAEKPIPPAHD